MQKYWKKNRYWYQKNGHNCDRKYQDFALNFFEVENLKFVFITVNEY